MSKKVDQYRLNELRGSLGKDDQALLDVLEKEAKVAASHRFWINRFFFGFGLAKEVESLVEKMDVSPTKPLNQQIPAEQLRAVVAAWVRFNYVRGFFALMLTSTLTLITATFLYQQLIHSKAEAILDKRVRNSQFLYNEKCEEKNDCEPEFNARLRAEAVLAYSSIALPTPFGADLQDAQLQQTNLTRKYENIDFQRTNFSNAKLKGIFDNNLFDDADFKEALIGGTILNSSFDSTVFDNALFSGVFIENQFIHVAFTDVLFDRVTFASSDFEFLDLSTTMMRHAEFLISHISSATINLSECDICKFTANSTINNVDFESNEPKKNEVSVYFGDVLLEGVNFTGNSLHARFEDSTLVDVAFIDIDIHSSFENVIFSGVWFDTLERIAHAQFENVRYDSSTEFPVGFEPKNHNGLSEVTDADRVVILENKNKLEHLAAQRDRNRKAKADKFAAAFINP